MKELVEDPHQGIVVLRTVDFGQERSPCFFPLVLKERVWIVKGDEYAILLSMSVRLEGRMKVIGLWEEVQFSEVLLSLLTGA